MTSGPGIGTGGRASGRRSCEAAEGADGREYVDKLHALATGPHTDTKARLQAIRILLERGWGAVRHRSSTSSALRRISPA